MFAYYSCASHPPSFSRANIRSNQSAAVDKASLIAECQKSCPRNVLQARVAAAAARELPDDGATCDPSDTVPLIVALEAIGGPSRTYLEWLEVEALVFREKSPHTMYHSPPTPLRLTNLSMFRTTGSLTDHSVHQSVVHEIVADPCNTRLFVLMDNGRLEVWDGHSYEVSRRTNFTRCRCRLTALPV